MITVIDYGAGNLRSVENTLKFLHVPHQITSRSADVTGASAILLPGVGHFGQMMRSLEQMGVVSVLRDRLHAGVPYLGICLGMHALFEGSEEAPEFAGLNIFRGTIQRFPDNLPAGFKVPHMGWNQIAVAPSGHLLTDIGAKPFVYFAHSYYLPVGLVEEAPDSGKPMAAATSDYAGKFVAAVEHRNIFGTQFHPEKSGDLGLKVVANFAAICARRGAVNAG